MNNLAKMAIALVAVGALSYSVGRYLQPAKIQIKKETVIKEIEVVKKDIVVIEKTTKRPDGTVVTEKRTEDRSTESTKKSSEEKESTIVSNLKPQYRVRGGAGFDFNDKEMQYMVGGEKRFWGPISLGLDVTLGSGTGLKAAGVTASLEF